MSTATYDGDIYEDGNQFKDDKNLVVFFDVKAVRNLFQSELQNRAVFDNIEHITIITPGSRDTLVSELTDHYKNRFRERYEKWKTKHENEVGAGTPIREVPWFTPAMVAEYEYAHVKTLEQLISVPESAYTKMPMGVRQDVERAKRWLEATTEGEVKAGALQTELAKRDEQIAKLMEQVAALTAPKEEPKLVPPKATTKV